MRFIILFLFAFSQFSLAQNHQLDSIQKVLLTSDSPEQKADIYKKLAYYYMPQDYGLALLYADSSFYISQSIGDTIMLADSYSLYATLKLRRGDFDAAQKNYNSYEELFEGFANSKYLANEAFLTGELGVFHYYKSNLDSALIFFNKSIEVNTTLNNENVVARMQSNIGTILYHDEQYDQALVYFRNAQAIFESSVKDSIALLNVFNNIGLIFNDLSDPSKAIDYFNKGIDLAEKLNSDINLEMLYLNLGTSLVGQKKYDLALNLFEKSLVIKKKNQIPYGINLERIASLYFMKGLLNESKKFYTSSIAEMNKYQDEIHLLDAQLGLVNVHLELKEYTKAVVVLEEALTKVDTDKRDQKLLSIYKQLMQTYLLVENIEKSKYYSELFLVVNDFVNDITITGKVYEMESSFQLAQKENEVLILQQSNKIERNYWQKLLLGSVGIGLFILAILLIIIFRSSTLSKNFKIIELENKEKNTEILNNTMLLAKQNESAANFLLDLKELKTDFSLTNLSTLQDKIKTSVSIENSWDEYLSSFYLLNPRFIRNLKSLNIELSSSEKRLSALVIQGLTLTEIGNIINIAPSSVGKARIRLRKKLMLKSSDDLGEFLVSLTE